MNVVATTAAYDRWLARRLRVIVKSDLKRKHREMSEDPFSFLRASFYRWAQIWPQQCADLTAAPKVLGVGDLHVEQRAYWERLLKLGRATVPPTPGGNGLSERGPAGEAPAVSYLSSSGGPRKPGAPTVYRVGALAGRHHRPGGQGPHDLSLVVVRWKVVRRLAPDCSRIEMKHLAGVQDECRLLWMMGWETGNVHLGTPRQRGAIRRDLRKRKGQWLLKAARAMRNATIEDWREWRDR